MSQPMNFMKKFKLLWKFVICKNAVYLYCDYEMLIFKQIWSPYTPHFKNYAFSDLFGITLRCKPYHKKNYITITKIIDSLLIKMRFIICLVAYKNEYLLQITITIFYRDVFGHKRWRTVLNPLEMFASIRDFATVEELQRRCDGEL